MTKKKTAKKIAKTPKESEILLQLDGHIYVIDKQPGKKTVKTELDGKMVLQILLNAIVRGIEMLEDPFEEELE